MASEPEFAPTAQSATTVEAPSSATGPATGLDGWLTSQIEALRRTHDVLVSSDFRLEALVSLLEVAEDLQARAVGLGYPLAGAVAASLRHLIDGTADTALLPRVLVRQHVDAIRAIVAEGAFGDD